MPDKGWKAFERRMGGIFGVCRTPLSGSCSRLTSSDTLHPKLFIEVKVRRGIGPLWRFFRGIEGLASKENKRPVLIVKVPRADDLDSIVACRLRDLKAVAEEVNADHADG